MSSFIIGGKQLNALREGLPYDELISEYFLESDNKITAQLMMEIIQWETDVLNQQKKQWSFKTIYRRKRFTNIDIFSEIFVRPQLYLFFK